MNSYDERLRYALDEQLAEWAAGDNPDFATGAKEEIQRRAGLTKPAAERETINARMAKDIHTIRNVVLFWFWCGIVAAVGGLLVLILNAR